ncbi:MAG: glutaminase A [Microthrixaceae bacterium]
MEMTGGPGASSRRRLVSTGTLPQVDVIDERIREAHARFRDVTDGHVADYIPALADASPDWFGIAVCGVAGTMRTVGDADRAFSIQSVSKPFVFALVCDAIGTEEARERLGANATGQPFDSVIAVELDRDKATNPLVNAGAIASTSLAPGSTAEERWEFVRSGLSRFAGRELAVDEGVYASESATNQRNRGIAHLLAGYGRIYADPEETTDLYTRQCSLLVSARDLAVMGATLADGGVNPLTGEKVVDPDVCTKVLAVLVTAGLYERSGDWLYDIGLPGKSGVSGGMVTVSPGKGGLGTFSPPLDEAGNSVRGRLATAELAHALGLNLFASEPLTR